MNANDMEDGIAVGEQQARRNRGDQNAEDEVDEVDDIEDEEDDDDDDDEDDEEDPRQAVNDAIDIHDNNPDIVEGGVADVDEPGKLASEADITLFVVCTETMKKMDHHPILSPGVTVQIGLGKSTRLESVFERYVKVCNNRDPANREISVNDLEFVHSTILKANETAEQAALMKDDRIRVRAERSLSTHHEKERAKIQRESDQRYFIQMRELLRPDPVLASDTIYLDCRGTIPTNNQPRIRFPIPGVMSLACHACPWLRRKIDIGLALQNIYTFDRKQSIQSAFGELGDLRAHQTSPSGAISEGHDSGASITRDEDDEDLPIRMVDRNLNERQGEINGAAAAAPAAAEIELEGDELVENEEVQEMGSKRVVVIYDHPPEAVSMLLEYCYTNRVLSLGAEAFKVAAETRLLPRENQGNVPPFSLSGGAKKWPNRGEPTVTFHVALAGLIVAEDAQIPRFSLMCEVAASQLIDSSNVVSALTVCARIQTETGNTLTRLRQAAMNVLLHAKRFVTDKTIFRQALQDEPKWLVPTLLQGLVQSMTDSLDRRTLYEYENRDWQTTAYAYFDQCDREDNFKRARERRQRRIERHPDGEQPLIVDEYEAFASFRSLKRVRTGGHTSIRSVLRRTEKRDRRNSR